jgi:TRAP-type C4-dicarboxylate transport system permease small subunit
MKYFEQISKYLNKIFLIVGGIAVLALMTVATANVVLRIFHIPFRGAYELVSFIGAIVIAFALGFTQQLKGHIVVDILTEKFPKKLSKTLDMVNHLVTMVFFAIIAWQIYRVGMQIWSSGELSETLKMIYHPFIFAVSLGFITLSLTALVQLMSDMRRGEEN